MSGNLNKVFLMGNLVRDPELRHTGQGSSVTNFDIAVNRSWKNSNGEICKETDYFKIVVWGKSGENCNKYLAKGRPVLVEGRLFNQKWEDNNGQKRTTTQIIADNVQFLGSGKADSGNAGAGDSNDDFGGDGFNPDDDQVPF